MNSPNNQTGPTSSSMMRYHAASEKMGFRFSNTSVFIVNALEWLGERLGDVHLEFHEHDGWQVSTCYAEERWGEDSWIRGDGSMASALCHAIEITPLQQSDERL